MIIKEFKNEFVVIKEQDKLKVQFKISKDICKTKEEVKQFIKENNL